MKKKKFNIIEINKIFKSLIGTMIPESKSELMPSAARAIKISVFLKNILKSNKLKKKIYKVLIATFEKNKKINYSSLGIKIAKSKIMEKDLEKYLLESYFSSKLVQKQLLKKTNKILSSKKTNNKDNLSLLKLVKKSSLRYKHT